MQQLHGASIALFAVLALATGVSCFAQTARDPLFETLAGAIDQARKEGVDALAPDGFAAAESAWQAAAKDQERGQKADRIHARLTEGTTALDRAVKAAAQAREQLSAAVKTREDALTANAPKLGGEPWQKGEARFREAMIANERGDAANARKRAAESDVLLREAELVAIKGGVLNEARGLIARAEEAKVGKRAPRSLEAAKRHLADAETEIQRNRYDLGTAKQLAGEARYEALHATWLARTINAALEQGDDKGGLEAMLLAWEEPLARIAAGMEVSARFDQGPEAPLREIAERSAQQREDLRLAKQELAIREEQIATLNREKDKLEARLGGESAERITLQRRVDATETLRLSIVAVEGAFSPDEAHVYRQGDDVVISLTGIRFASGRSKIDPGSAELMNKVRTALGRFPDASVSVEGHTDSNGSDSANLILSQDRADAVKQYLIDNAQRNPEKVSSIGYGEARPVATNETAEGRARNRRIDLVIHLTAR